MKRHPLSPGMVARFLCVSFVAAALPAAAAGVDNTKVRSAETAFGDFLAEALLHATHADLAFVNAGAVRDKVAEATPEALQGLLVFPAEKVAVLSLTGDQVKRALERSVGSLPTPSNGFLQAAGIKLVYDPTAPKGKRVKSVTLLKTGKPVEAGTKYRVAAPEGLARGAQGYFTVFGRAALKETTDHTVGEALETYLAAGKRPPAAPVGRLSPLAR